MVVVGDELRIGDVLCFQEIGVPETGFPARPGTRPDPERHSRGVHEGRAVHAARPDAGLPAGERLSHRERPDRAPLGVISVE